jgi:proteic killer suppression protein
MYIEMDVEFANDDYDRLETDAAFDMGLAPGLVKAYRMRMQGLRSASDERDLYAIKSWRFEKLKGNRKHQCSIRLNDQFRLVLEIQNSSEGKHLRIMQIEDYH